MKLSSPKITAAVQVELETQTDPFVSDGMAKTVADKSACYVAASFCYIRRDNHGELGRLSVMAMVMGQH